jgi:uncharacterized protein (AIM24 family)
LSQAILALEDGTVFEGRAFGAPAERTGEVVFNTSITGYQEIITDPSYTGQIVINNLNKGKQFIAGGDSGSLMVEDVATAPRAVGLLFAGSSTSAIANPIGEVLSFLGATMVGQ